MKSSVLGTFRTAYEKFEQHSLKNYGDMHPQMFKRSEILKGYEPYLLYFNLPREIT